MKNHKHCKLCGAYIGALTPNIIYPETDKEIICNAFSICENCILNEGIKSIKKRIK